MKPLIWDYRPDGLRAPALACAFRGWNDAGDASTTALKVIGRSLDSRRFARIDAEEFFDFQTHRPIVELSDGVTREIRWPRNDFREAHVPEASRDLVLLTANEPSMKWRTYCQTVLDLGDALGAQLVVTLGSLLAEVPHSRPTPLTGLASDPALLSSMEIEPPNYEGPTGIVGVLHSAAVEHGVPTVSLWASVPYYVGGAPSPKAALALVRGFETVTGIPIEADNLQIAADEYERQVSQAVESDPEAQEFVERLERSSDGEPDEEDADSVDGDQIAREFQRFLRQRESGS